MRYGISSWWGVAILFIVAFGIFIVHGVVEERREAKPSLELKYSIDTTTNLCFAEHSDQGSYTYSITCVPCTDSVKHIIHEQATK